MGADQILEARVLLANGNVVTANHCEHRDLFTAIRGGGPGYGIVLGTTVKAYPNIDVVTAHHLSLAPIRGTSNKSDLLDAVTILLQSLPDLSDAGFAGYGFWSSSYPGPFIGNATSGYSHGFWTIGVNQSEADAAFAPVRAKLQVFNDTLSISDGFASYTDYWSFYEAESGLYDAAGSSAILTSRLINRRALANHAAVREAVEVIAGKLEEYTVNVINLVSGGKVFTDAADETSGLHPAWRTSNYFVTVGRGVALNASNAERYSAMDDMTYVKGAALKSLAPDTGGYMNEGDRNDPDWKATHMGTSMMNIWIPRRSMIHTTPSIVLFVWAVSGLWRDRTCLSVLHEVWIRSLISLSNIESFEDIMTRYDIMCGSQNTEQHGGQETSIAQQLRYSRLLNRLPNHSVFYPVCAIPESLVPLHRVWSIRIIALDSNQSLITCRLQSTSFRNESSCRQILHSDSHMLFGL